ncbi:MAG TPA: DUF2207 domain-containing protein [Longimicrobiales bacterium]|nr:DUF2207 domain-containing protein [Longimicrobiales bacterium]
MIRLSTRLLRHAIALVALLALAPATAHARTLSIQGFDVEVVVRRDGSLLVTEHITAHFEGSWNGLYRTIPVIYPWNGFNYRLRVDLQSATDQRGNELRVETDRSGDMLRWQVWVPGASDATHTITLQYIVENGLRFFEEHDELYWNVTGNEWDIPVGHATAQVVLPTAAANIRAASYTGPAGATNEGARTEIVANSVQVRTTSPLAFREGLTLVVGWDPGVVERPTTFERATGLLAANGILIAPLLALVFMHGWWRRHGRDPEQLSIVPQYEPPKDLTPGEVGILVDNTADMRDVTATIVDLAVRGYLVIEDEQDEHLFGLVKTRDYAFVLTRPHGEWGELRPHERAMLNALFTGESRTRVTMDELENTFYKDLADIRKRLMESLVEHGFCTRRPDRVIGMYVALAIVSGVVIGLGGSALLSARGESPLPAIIAGVLTGIVMLAYGTLMPARTVRGARTREHALGFSEFLRRVEKDRFERVIRTPEMFEKFLPFAMAFGIEKNWARAFDDIYREPPDWYRGARHDTFVAHMFVSDLSRMSQRAGSAMSSSPRGSAGGSGFSGGSSGGGFGGGGGGGF